MKSAIRHTGSQRGTGVAGNGSATGRVGVKARKGADKSLAEIIEEESASCLAGFQTPEKTAKVLNKRVKNEIP